MIRVSPPRPRRAAEDGSGTAANVPVRTTLSMVSARASELDFAGSVKSNVKVTVVSVRPVRPDRVRFSTEDV